MITLTAKPQTAASHHLETMKSISDAIAKGLADAPKPQQTRPATPGATNDGASPLQGLIVGSAPEVPSFSSLNLVDPTGPSDPQVPTGAGASRRDAGADANRVGDFALRTYAALQSGGRS